MSGIADVARLAGVSKATASRALTGNGYVSAETRARVQEAARTLDYVASTNAASLVTGRTRNIGVIMPSVTRWFLAEVLEGIQDSLLDHGLDLTLYDSRPGTAGRARIFDDFLARKRFDGLIAVGLEPHDRELSRLQAIGRPMISVVGDVGDPGTISIDDRHAGRRATEHLIGLGHRDIAFVGGGETEPHWTHWDRRRLEGYLSAMRDAGLAPLARHIECDVSLPGGYAAAVDLLGDSQRRPTGLVCACDEVAIGAIIAARRLGIQVPSDLSVIGVDDHEFADVFSLTTLAQVPRDQGTAAVDLLLRHIADPSEPVQSLAVQARLVVRSSTSAVDRASSAIEAGTRPR